MRFAGLPLLLLIPLAAAGIYPVFFAQYKGERNVTMCWSTLDEDASLFRCWGWEDQWVSLYSWEGAWDTRLASMYARCPGFMMTEFEVHCEGGHVR